MALWYRQAPLEGIVKMNRSDSLRKEVLISLLVSSSATFIYLGF